MKLSYTPFGYAHFVREITQDHRAKLRRSVIMALVDL